MDDKAPLIDRCLSVDVRFVAVRYFEMARGFGCLFHLQRVSGYGPKLLIARVRQMSTPWGEAGSICYT